MSSCGAAIYDLLCNLVAPAKPLDENYCELIAVMNKHQNLKPSVIKERYKFNKRHRQPGDSIPFCVTELKRLSELCDFGLSLVNMMRDRFICGLRNTKIQQQLLAEIKLNFEALTISCAMERVKKDVRDTEDGASGIEKMGESVNNIQGRWKEISEKWYKKGQECFWC